LLFKRLDIVPNNPLEAATHPVIKVTYQYGLHEITERHSRTSGSSIPGSHSEFSINQMTDLRGAWLTKNQPSIHTKTRWSL